jgi:hypothetical protein
MGALDGAIWVCAECRSINNERAKQCYNCRTPKERAAVDPATIDPSSHGKLREVELPSFHAAKPFAAVASILILATAGMQVVYTLDYSSLVLQTLGDTPATEEQLVFMGLLGLVTLGIGVLALVAWSLWLSRVVSAMPALGLGYPSATGLTAFIENFLPGLNLLRVPAIVRDVVRRVDPASGRGEALIFAAWIGLLGGFVVPRVLGLVNGLTAETDEAALRSQLTIQGISIGLVVVGAIFLVALIWWIEARISRRREAQLAAIDAAAAGVADDRLETTEEGVAVPAASSSQTAEGPSAAASWAWRDTSDSPLAASGAGSVATAAVPGPGWDSEPSPFDTLAAGVGQAPTVTQGPAAAKAPATAPPEPAPSRVAKPTREPATPPATATPPAAVIAPVAPTAPEPATVAVPPSPSQPAPAATGDSREGPPHLTIRVVNMGMLQAEMGGESEPVILEDLSAYGKALADAGGTAAIVVTGNDGMAQLIARRAQQILADAGIEASIPD